MSSQIPLTVLIVSLLLEIINILLSKDKSTVRTYISATNIMFISFAVTSFLFYSFSIFTILLFIVGMFRVVNVSRVAINRMKPAELQSRYIRSMFWLTILTVLLVLAIYNNPVVGIGAFALTSFFLSLVIFITTIYSMIRWRNRKLPQGSLKNLPTVSVCIPARNETQDLPECIETILASTYTKLEILVLDDCSHDKTPAVIKEYAHRGVRFIKGQEPEKSWIAKNSAMNKLFEEARGEIVVFAGVDVRFSPNSIYNIIEQMEYGLLDMVSVLPRRTGSAESSIFIQPLRYWWELSVPRLFGKRPPALSTLWAIKSKKLKESGGFDSVRRSVRPEAHFAKRLSDSYRFVLSGSRMDITSVKGPKEQFDTALRMRYPQTRRRPESVLAVMLLEILIFIAPIVALIDGVVNQHKGIFLTGILSLIMLTLVNLYISYLTVQKTWFAGLITLPFLVIEEWYVLVRSMLAYEFGEVRWKERNICLPMLQVEKELPKI